MLVRDWTASKALKLYSMRTLLAIYRVSKFDKVGTKFDHVIIDSAITHVLVLSTKVRRNKLLW